MKSGLNLNGKEGVLRKHETEIEAIHRRIDRIQGVVIAKIDKEFAALRDDINQCKSCDRIIFGERRGRRMFCSTKCRVRHNREGV